MNIDAAGLVVTDRLATDKADPKPLTSLSLACFILNARHSMEEPWWERSGDILIKTCEPNVTAALEDAEYSRVWCHGEGDAECSMRMT